MKCTHWTVLVYLFSLAFFSNSHSSFSTRAVARFDKSFTKCGKNGCIVAYYSAD